MKYLSILLLLLTTTACTSIPLKTLYKLRNASPLQAPAEHIRVAIRSDKNLQIKQGNVQLELGYQTADNQLDIHDIYFVEVQEYSQKHNQLPTALLNNLQDNQQVIILKLTAADAAQFKQRQQLISQYEQTGKKGQGWLIASVNGGCYKSAKQPTSLPTDIFIQFDPQDSYLLFVEDLDILSHEQMANTHIGKCN